MNVQVAVTLDGSWREFLTHRRAAADTIATAWWPVAGVEAQAAHQGRRSRVAGGRKFPVQCLFDDAEIATIREAAVGEGTSVGAWCSSVALRAAREQAEPLDADWRLVMRELMASTSRALSRRPARWRDYPEAS
jgi:hypothetical protein